VGRRGGVLASGTLSGAALIPSARWQRWPAAEWPLRPCRAFVGSCWTLRASTPHQVHAPLSAAVSWAFGGAGRLLPWQSRNGTPSRLRACQTVPGLTRLSWYVFYLTPIRKGRRR